MAQSNNVPVLAYGDTYGGVAQNELAQQAAEDAFLFSLLGHQAQRRSVDQSANQYDRSLAFQGQSRELDEQYRRTALAEQLNQAREARAQQERQAYDTLNLQNRQFQQSMAQNQGQQGFANELAALQVRAAQAARPEDVSYRERALAQGTDLSRLGIQEQARATDLQAQLSREQIEAATGQRTRAESSARYDQLVNLVGNGAIRTPQQLASYDTSTLTTAQLGDLANLLTEATTRQNQAYRASEARATALNAQLSERLAPLQPAYDRATQKLASAPERGQGRWYWPDTFKDEVSTGPITAYQKARDEFQTVVGENKLYGDVIYDPTSKRFVPAIPRPEAYSQATGTGLPMPSPQATPAAPGTAALPSMDDVRIPFNGQTISLPRSLYEGIKARASQLDPGSRQAVVQQAIMDALARGQARRIQTQAAVPTDNSFGPYAGLRRAQAQIRAGQ